ncbi:MAG: hypothetical protein GYA62_03775 [Bacteroidales bacterium]|nr:hypothetical protein [Bacteroidales bacterium]
MNYWITTHWPPRVGKDSDSIGSGVWLPDGREEAGNDLRPGDKVIIYQARSGRPEVRVLPNGDEEIIRCLRGKEGIVAICQALSNVYKRSNIKPTKYIDGTEIWWCWSADLKIISKSGFLSRENINKILGYKTSYNYRGFGDLHSGLKKITKKQFDNLVDLFIGNIDTVKTPNKKRLNSENNGESLSHFLLKHYVASHSSIVLNEENVKKFQIEFSFPTGDRADILLTDNFGRIIGVEIEITVDDQEYEGILQAIKYRYMSELMTKRKLGDSRAILVAYSISKKMKKVCASYDVEYIEVNKNIVNKWAKSNEGLRIKKSYKK